MEQSVQKLTDYGVPKLMDIVSKRTESRLTEKELRPLLFLSFFDGINLNRYLIRNAVQCPGHRDSINISQN